MNSFEIDLRDVKEGMSECSFHADNTFFERNTGEIQGGDLQILLSLQRRDTFFELQFSIEGWVSVSCDLCLDAMQQPISVRQTIGCRLSDEAPDDDETIYVAPEDGVLCIEEIVLELTELAIPIRHVHAPGKCNAAMMNILNEYSVSRRDAGKEQATDPRWDALKKLKE